MALLRETMRPLMWRSSKVHVKDELAVPPMTHRLIKLELTTAEREVYSKIHAEVQDAAAATKGGGQLVEGDLMQLRLACAHPQMTRFWTRLDSEAQIVPGGGSTSLSMTEVLERMMTMAIQAMESQEREMCKQVRAPQAGARPTI